MNPEQIGILKIIVVKFLKHCIGLFIAMTIGHIILTIAGISFVKHLPFYWLGWFANGVVSLTLTVVAILLIGLIIDGLERVWESAKEEYFQKHR